MAEGLDQVAHVRPQVQVAALAAHLDEGERLHATCRPLLAIVRALAVRSGSSARSAHREIYSSYSPAAEGVASTGRWPHARNSMQAEHFHIATHKPPDHLGGRILALKVVGHRSAADFPPAFHPCRIELHNFRGTSSEKSSFGENCYAHEPAPRLVLEIRSR